MFLEVEDDNDSGLPMKYRHVRISERIVKEEFYQTIASLIRAGLSTPEAISAVVIVGNGMFGTKWKNHGEAQVLDIDTVPHRRQVLEANKLIECQSLSLVVEEVQKSKEEGRMITHGLDSTTKKGAGQFAVAGLHIGQDIPFPLPILPIHGERTSEIAMQVVVS